MARTTAGSKNITVSSFLATGSNGRDSGFNEVGAKGKSEDRGWVGDIGLLTRLFPRIFLIDFFKEVKRCITYTLSAVRAIEL